MFSALRQGSIIYILDKKDKPELKIGSVISATSPNNYNYLNTGTLDINVKVEDKTLEFKQLPSAMSIANYNNGNTIISESKELMCQEVENMINSSKQIIDNIPYHEVVITNGEEILKQLNPQFAKQKDQEEKINNLESKVGNVENKLDTITTMLTQILNK